jgi:hypothetical protein
MDLLAGLADAWQSLPVGIRFAILVIAVLLFLGYFSGGRRR